MNTKPLYIFDLDGTLALIEHRRHLVEGITKDWPAFFAACVHDKPNPCVIATLERLMMGGAEVWIWSGRSDEVEEETMDWLKQHLPEWWVGHGKIQMRKAGDHQNDEKLKRDWFAALKQEDRIRLIGIFDDRDRVVAMWRSIGVTCFQVASGNF